MKSLEIGKKDTDILLSIKKVAKDVINWKQIT